MKYLPLLLIFVCSFASADIYVVTAPDKSVYSISNQNDAVVPSGYSVDVIKGKSTKDLAIGDDTSLYNYNGKKFILDDGKVAKKNKSEQDFSIERENRKQAKASAIEKLKALGLTDSEILALIK